MRLNIGANKLATVTVILIVASVIVAIITMKGVWAGSTNNISTVESEHNVLSTSDPDCYNSGSSSCDSIVVEAWITGTDPYSSSGGGRADGYVVDGGICCVITAAARMDFGYRLLGEWFVYIRVLDFDGSVSMTFYPAGDATSTSVEINWCDNVRPSVEATLSGLCLS